MIEVREAPREHYGWIAQRASLIVGDSFRAIEAVESDRILGMVGYDGWTPNSCAMHVAIDDKRAAHKLLRPAFGIPFTELKKGVVLGSVLSTNAKALVLDRKLGFRQVARLRDVWQPGVDLIIFEMRREECRWLKE